MTMKFLRGILSWPKLVSEICIHCNSQLIIERAQSHMYNDRDGQMTRSEKFKFGSNLDENFNLIVLDFG